MPRAITILGAGAVLGALATLAPVTIGQDIPVPQAPLAVPQPTEELPAGYHPAVSFAPLVEAVEPAVVAIEVKGTAPGHDLSGVPPMFRDFFGLDPRMFGPRTIRGEGSGFIVSADGLLLTNHHVIARAQEIHARLADGSRAQATLLGSDPTIDVALLRLEGGRTWPHVKLGSSHDLRVGDWVLAMGNPLGLGHTVTAGIISGKGRALGHGQYDDFLQTDAAINQGNSGGPLFNLRGEVVGINTAIIQGANTVGFAIPIDMVTAVMSDLETVGRARRGYIGVRPQALDDDLAQNLRTGTTEGALIAQVFDDTPAAAAGLQQGDVVVRVDDTEVKDPVDLVRAIGLRRPGETVELGVLRRGRTLTKQLELGEHPEMAALAERQRTPRRESRAQGAADRLGVGLAALSPQMAAELGVSSGVLVESVHQGSAADGHLRAGDVILEINHWPVSSPAEADQLLARSRGSALLLLVRNQAQQFIAIQMP